MLFKPWKFKNYAHYAFTKRNHILQENGYSTYQEFLKSDLWKETHKKIEEKQKKGIEYWSKCSCCGSRNNLHIHHIRYKKRMTKVSLNDLTMLCSICHSKVHQLTQEKNISFKVALRKLSRINISNKTD
jgi:5-methylcytosine-specific restriction endonuclease McrA